MSTTTNTKPTVNAKKRKVEESKVETEGLLIVENIETFLKRVRELALDTMDTQMFEDIDDDVKPYLKWAKSLKDTFDTSTLCQGALKIPVALIKCIMKKVDPIIDNNDEKHDMFDILTEFCHEMRKKLEDDDDSDEWLEALTIRLTVDPVKPPAKPATAPAKPAPAKPAKRARLIGPNEFAAATTKLASVDPNKFFNGEVVRINMGFTNGSFTILFHGSTDGTVTIKGDFPRASVMSAQLPIEELGRAACYQAVCEQLLPTGIEMVIHDYPIAKAKHEKDLEAKRKD